MHARTVAQEAGVSDGFMIIQGHRRKCKSEDIVDNTVRPSKHHRKVDNSVIDKRISLPKNPKER